MYDVLIQGMIRDLEPVSKEAVGHLRDLKLHQETVDADDLKALTEVFLDKAHVRAEFGDEKAMQGLETAAYYCQRLSRLIRGTPVLP